MPRMDPRIERIALQIWHLTDATGGECTLADLADFTGVEQGACAGIANSKGWTGRYRKVAIAHGTSEASYILQDADRLGAPAGMVQW